VIDLPSKIGWRRRDEDGMIVTWDLPNGAEHVPMLATELREGLDRVEQQWGELCRDVAIRHEIPEGWLQSMIWRESGGNPKALRHETDKEGKQIVVKGRPLTGVGLMQITSNALKKAWTDAELMGPKLNVEIGATYVANLASRVETQGADGKPDFARIAAAFNAGSVRPSTMNEWGMVMTRGHVSAEVAAYNYWLSTRMAEEQKVAALAMTKQFTLFELIPTEGPIASEPEKDA